ncbi:MAG: discoidin domain-containing protein [Planctomycetaceae bacterium]
MPFVRSSATLFCAICFSLVHTVARGDNPVGQTPPPKPLRVLLITGGCCHDYTAQKSIIAKGLWARAYIDVEVVQQGGSATNSKIEVYDKENWSEGYDVVIHDECFADVKDTAYVDNILKPHKEGLPGVVVHCAMHCYRDGRDEWFKFCGVTSRRHGAHYAHEVLNRDAEHPIMKGFPAGWANPAGELYWIEKLWETAHPLASAKNREKGNEEVCVWTNTYGKGRVFGTTLGHHNVTVEDPVFLDMLTRGVLWAANKLDDPTYLKTSSDKPKLVPVNLAKGAKATASSEETGKKNFAINAIDGNGSTRWCAGNGSAPQWLQVDFAEPTNLKGATIKWESDQTVYKYTLEVAINEGNWIPLVDESKNGKNGTHEFQFNAPDVQYVRVNFLGSNTGGWGSIWELSLHGDEMVAIDPQQQKKESEAAFLSDVKVPDEFDATLFAAPPAVKYPVYVAAAPEGVVYVSVDQNGSLDREKNRGAIYRLRDVDGDGRADETKLFVDNVDSPRGLVWDHDRLYVMHPPHLSAFIDHDGDGISDEQKFLVKNIAFDFKDRPADHTSNGVTLGIDGWLYLAIGDFGFMEAEGADGTKLQFRSGGVVRVRPDGTGLEVYSRGTRNILEVAMDPLLNGFTRDNTNDGGGWDIRLHHFSGLEHHGYPSLYMNFGDEIVQPLADYGGGSGCGALYLDEPGFPEGYGNALYTADWGRSIVYRHHLTPNGGTFTPDQDEFLKATRVTDLDCDANGHLYVTSWKGATFTYAGDDVGYLVRVSPKNAKTTPLPNFDDTNVCLSVLATSPSHRRRLEAQRAILRRGVDQTTVNELDLIVTDSSKPLANRVAALYALKQAGAPLANLAKTAVEDPALFPLVLRALGDAKGVGTPWDKVPSTPATEKVDTDPISLGLRSVDPRTKIEASIAVARLGQTELGTEVAKLLDDADPIVRHTAVQSLILLGDKEPCFAIVDATTSSATLRVGALRVLQGLHQPEVVEGLISRLAKETDPQKRNSLQTALCRLNFVDGVWKGNSWGTRPDTSGPYYQPERWSESDKIEAVLKQALETATGDAASALLTQLDRHKVKLDGTLERALAIAQADRQMIPTAIGELSRAKQIPATAHPLLKEVAADASQAAALRSEAAILVLRTDVDGAPRLAFDTLLSIEKTEVPKEDFSKRKDSFNKLWNTLRKHRRLGEQIEWLTTTAAADGPAGLWASAALLSLAFDKETSPEHRELATKSIETTWNASSERQMTLLKAAREIKLREFEPRVREAMKSTDPKVAGLGNDIAKDWKLEAMPTVAGPFIKDLKAEEVAKLAMKSTKNVELGLHLFEKLACNKCHTVKKGDPLRGPYLPQVAKTYKREQLIESILDPSKTLAQGFVTQQFVLDDGTQIMGFVTSENAEEVTLRDKEGKEMKVAVKNIEARVKQTVSMMPEGIVKEITPSDLSALVDYLQSIAE